MTMSMNKLSEESSRLRTIWAQNIAKLGNVNNQAALVQKCKDKVDKQIKQENETIEQLQSSENDKIKDFKKEYFKKGAILLITFIVIWLFVYWFPKFAVRALHCQYCITDIHILYRQLWLQMAQI